MIGRLILMVIVFALLAAFIAPFFQTRGKDDDDDDNDVPKLDDWR